MKTEFILVSTISVLFQCLQYGTSYTCCRSDEIYDVEDLACVPRESGDSAAFSNNRSCADDRTHQNGCHGFLLHPEVAGITPSCTNVARDMGKKAYVAIYKGDVRLKFVGVDDYCINNHDKFIIQNRCEKQVVQFAGNQTIVLTETIGEGRECGIYFRYCQPLGNQTYQRSFRKCCGFGYIYDKNYSCVKSSFEFKPLLSGDQTEQMTALEPLHFENLDRLRIMIDNDNEYSVDAKNQLTSKKDGATHVHYCVEAISDTNNGQAAYKQVVIYEEKQKSKKLPPSFDLTFLSLETIFMGITFLVHLILPRFQNLPGRIILLYTSTYLVWNFLRIHLKVAAAKTAISCFLRLVALPYLKWSKCWWLFLFTFELLLRIKGIGTKSKKTQQKRLISYCFVAWVFNGLLVAAACLGEGLAFNDFRLVRDNLGCNFLNRALDPVATVYIIVIPCALSCILDTVLLVVVTKTIQETGTKITGHDHQNRQHRKRYSLIVRLYALGLTKIINAVVDISAIYLPSMELTRQVTLAVLGLIYAFAIFLIFCCKRSILCQIFRLRKRKTSITSSTNAFYTRKSRPEVLSSITEKSAEFSNVNEKEQNLFLQREFT